MIIDIYYSTVGLILDIMIITIPILFHFGASKRTRLKSYAVVYLMVYLVLGLPFEYIAQYLIIFFAIALSLYFIIKVDFRKFFLYVLYGIIALSLDLIGLNLGVLAFLIYTTIYKLILLKVIKKFYFQLNEKLKEKILSGASVSVIIIIGIIVGGIYVNR